MNKCILFCLHWTCTISLGVLKKSFFKYILICECGYKMKMVLDAFSNGLAMFILNVFLSFGLKCYLLQGVLTLISCITGILLSNKHQCKTFYIKKLKSRLIRILHKTQVFCFSTIDCSTVVLPLRANVPNGETYPGNSQKINSAHSLMLGRP